MSWNILPKVNLQYFLQKIKEKFYTKTESDARYSQTDEKVKQTAMGTDAKEYRVLLTTNDTNTEETNIVRKCSALRFQPSDGSLKLAKAHTQTSNANQIFEIGNNIPNGTAGNDTGVLRLYGKSQYYGQFVDSNNSLTTNRTYYLPNKSGTLALTDDAEKVKQTPTSTTESKGYRLLVSYTNDDNEETNTVRKAVGFSFNPGGGFTQIERKHTGTTTLGTTFALGNNIPNGTEGATFGAIRLFSKNIYQINLWDRFNSITANRSITFPDKSGQLALRDTVTRAKLDNNWNLLSSPCYTGDNTSAGITFVQSEGFITFTGTATSQLTYYVRRYSEEWTLPAGKYRLSGCPSGGSSTTYRLRVGADTSTSTTTWLGYDTGNGFEFTLTEEKIITVTFNIYNGHAIQDSLVVRPAIVQLNGGWVDLGNTTQISTIDAGVFSELRFVFNILNTQSTAKYQITVPVLTDAVPVPSMPGTTFSATGGYMGTTITAYFNADKAGNTITISNVGIYAVYLENYAFACEIYGKV